MVNRQTARKKGKKVMSFKKKNFEMKKKLRNMQKRLMKTAATFDAPEETFTVSVQAIQDRLEELKKNQAGFYAPEGSFPIRESVKLSVKEKCKKPEKGILEFFKELYPDSNFFELYKPTQKESTIGNKLKIAMDPKELKEIREKCLPKILFGSKGTTAWLRKNLVFVMTARDVAT
ncbi:hypothetical protein DAPPUDRAFT_115752 [Daphnia pulex]|uniref:Uncharacterized protein n=1 Tax=Daphnia pulex TaxID=6669 RepID=E9HME0_DAPPU|nr:hypothetical protein DAPPUDRAFT_115752 [Daphnia pulex]|eukprot:EFX67058.1 hypothetical protein DAPPUDRAFT_115752 [Daphnia pulex]